MDCRCQHAHVQEPAVVAIGDDRPRHVRRWFGRLARFGGWWFGMTGFMATFSVCPCCGQQGCPAGAAGIGLFGAILAMLWRPFRRIRERLGGCAAR